MSPLAVIVDTSALWQTVVAALIAGVGTTLAFSFALLGAIRFSEATRAGAKVRGARLRRPRDWRPAGDSGGDRLRRDRDDHEIASPLAIRRRRINCPRHRPRGIRHSSEVARWGPRVDGVKTAAERRRSSRCWRWWLRWCPEATTRRGRIVAAITLAFLVLIGLGARELYRQNRMTYLGLTDRHRAIFVGALGVIVLMIAGADELTESGGGLVFWLAALGLAIFAIVRSGRRGALAVLTGCGRR